jgi:CelD/BcsL family acetyltransferase involved in cellulose biosynthesis
MDMSAHAVALQAPFSEWRSTNLDASYGRELEKKRRQLHRKGQVRFGCCDDVDTIKSTMSNMREYRGPRFQQLGDGDLLQKPAYFEFYRDIALRGRGVFSRTYTLSVDGRPIAGVLGLSDKGKFLVIMGGFDHASYKKQSIGALMFEEVARDCIERGDTVLDFTIGDEPYKQLFGTRPSALSRISRVGSPLGSLAGFAIEQMPWFKRAAKRLVERRSPSKRSVAQRPALGAVASDNVN